MWKKSKPNEIDEQLLDAIVKAKREWKKYQFMAEESIEPRESLIGQEKLAKAKFLFLLRQARKRRLRVIRLT